MVAQRRCAADGCRERGLRRAYRRVSKRNAQQLAQELLPVSLVTGCWRLHAHSCRWHRRLPGVQVLRREGVAATQQIGSLRCPTRMQEQAAISPIYLCWRCLDDWKGKMPRWARIVLPTDVLLARAVCMRVAALYLLATAAAVRTVVAVAPSPGLPGNTCVQRAAVRHDDSMCETSICEHQAFLSGQAGKASMRCM